MAKLGLTDEDKPNHLTDVVGDGLERVTDRSPSHDDPVPGPSTNPATNARTVKKMAIVERFPFPPMVSSASGASADGAAASGSVRGPAPPGTSRWRNRGSRRSA